MNRIVNIAFLGPQGSYSHIALKKYANIYHFDNIVVEYSCQNFDEIIQLISSLEVEYGILPIVNSTSGAINEVYNLLQYTTLFLIGEIYIPIIHCILTIPNTSFEKIQTLYSHPEPFQQCSQFLSHFQQWSIVFCKSSADAMEKVSKLKNPNLAALGNENSGILLYGLQVIKKNLANKKNNTTRFIILGNKQIVINENIPTKTTLKLSTNYPPNIFIKKILFIFQKHNINIHYIKLQSIKHHSNSNTLFIDIQANLYNKHTQAVLKRIEKETTTLKILGCYPNFLFLHNN